MQLDELIVKLVLDVTGFNKGQKDATDALAKTKDQAVRSSKAIEASALSASQGVEKLGRQFLGLFALLAGAQGVKQFLSDLTTTDAALGRTAKNIDMSGKALSTWQGVATVAGGSAEGITGSMASLSNAMQVAALTGENKLSPVFRALGINLATTGGKARDIGAIMFDLNRAAQGMDPAKFSAMMGMIGIDPGTINLLEKSTADFRKLYAEQQRYAAGASDIEAAQRRQTGWRQLSLTVISLGRTVATALTPIMVSAMTAVQNWATANQEWLKTEIVTKVGEFVTWLKSLDWKKIGKDASDFAGHVKNIALALDEASKGVDPNSALFKAFEAFGAMLAVKVLGQLIEIGAKITAIGAMPISGPLAAFLFNPVTLATAATAAVLASGDPDKIPLIGKHPDVRPQDSDTGLPGVDNRPSDTSDVQAKAGGVWSWIRNNAMPDFGKAGESVKAFGKAIGWGDRLHNDDPKTKDAISDTAKATGETRDILKRQADAAAGGADGGGGAPTVLQAAQRVLRHAASAAGAGYTPAGGGGNTPAKGALAANQKEAYAAALKEGLSPTAARALVANMSGEGLAVPHDRHWDGTHYAQGIVQWDPTRTAAIAAHFGKQPMNMTVAEQTKAAIWEMKNKYPTTWRALQGDNGADMIGALVDDYERPGNRGRAKAQRMGYYRGFNPGAATSKPASPHAALDYHRTLMAGVMAHHTSHTVNHNDNSSDTRVGAIHVHTLATDAKGVAEDLRPYLFQGRDARQANRGLA